MKLSSFTCASLSRKRLLRMMWPVFEKLLSELALEAGTHSVCLAIMATKGQSFSCSCHQASPEEGRPHWKRALWYASTWLRM